MPCLNEAAHIEACLQGVLAQDYRVDRMEILVADGGSTDGTVDILTRIAAQEARLRVVPNPERLQAPGLNLVVRQARGEVIVRMDVHCRYAPDYVRRCVEVLERTGAQNVGGAQRPLPGSPFEQALCAALTSPLGMGGARYRSAENEGFVDTVFLGAFRKAVFDQVGLYDPKAITNEDAELNQRILQAGGRIYLSREIVVHYRPRGSLAGLARQYFRYGQGRARTLLKHGRLRSIRPILPFLVVTSGLLLFTVPVLGPLAPWAFGVYGAAVLLEAFRHGHRRGAATTLRLMLIFPILHLSHGIGFAAGLARYISKPDWPANPSCPSERL